MKDIWQELSYVINDLGIDDFLERYSIQCNYKEGLYCLTSTNDSPVAHWITRACNGVILSYDDYFHIEAVGLERIFEFGDYDAIELHSKFDWSQSVLEHYLGGEFVKLFYFQGNWILSTDTDPTGGRTRLKFWETFGKVGESTEDLDPEKIYIYELGDNYLELFAARWADTFQEIDLYESYITIPQYPLGCEGRIIKDVNGNRMMLRKYV